jgi:hypothetical protein
MPVLAEEKMFMKMQYKKALSTLIICLGFVLTGCHDNQPSCNRDCLIGFINQYLEALITHNPSSLPLAKDVRYTENGQLLGPGDGLWNTASDRGTYKLYIADPQAGQAGFFGTIRENGVPTLLALRLKIENMQIIEIETLVVRSDSDAIKLEKIGTPHPVFLEAVAPEKRMSRDSLMRTANMYFTALECNDGKGIYPFTTDCNRIENGKQTTNNPSNDGGPIDIQGMGCKEQFESGFFNFVTRIHDRRFVVVDEERGLVLTFVFFDHAGNIPEVTLTNGMTIPIGVKRPWTWEIAELFKIENGLIRQIEAICQESPYGMGSGWSIREQSISSEPIYK